MATEAQEASATNNHVDPDLGSSASRPRTDNSTADVTQEDWSSVIRPRKGAVQVLLSNVVDGGRVVPVAIDTTACQMSHPRESAGSGAVWSSPADLHLEVAHSQEFLESDGDWEDDSDLSSDDDVHEATAAASRQYQQSKKALLRSRPSFQQRCGQHQAVSDDHAEANDDATSLKTVILSGDRGGLATRSLNSHLPRALIDRDTSGTTSDTLQAVVEPVRKAVDHVSGPTPQVEYSPLEPSQQLRQRATHRNAPSTAPDVYSSAQVQHPVQPSSSLWEYLWEEILATDYDSTQELKWERVTNFMSIPLWMEKIMALGFAVCSDAFLYTFTILPLRVAVALWCWISNGAHWALTGHKRYLHSSHKCDMLKALLIIMGCTILTCFTDASKLYHSVRGQDTIKLHVIFTLGSILDRLCCSIGQDLLDSLFSRATLARRRGGQQPYVRACAFFTLCLVYVLVHTMVLQVIMVTLNVAINSFDNALLTLLLSDQFVEIKGSVFKRFETINVLQLTLADIVERFQLALMLTMIGAQNLIEVAGASSDGSAGPLPTSFTVFPSLSLVVTSFAPVLIVMASECVVDWLKHGFITKFNNIRPAVYGRFMDVLCRDLVVAGPAASRTGSRKHSFVDQSPIIARRLGFAAIPLACLLVCTVGQIFGMLSDTSHFDECAISKPPLLSSNGTSHIPPKPLQLSSPTLINTTRWVVWLLITFIAWAFLVAIKLLLGSNLVWFATHRHASSGEREIEEKLNSKTRPPIGVGKDELAYDNHVKAMVNRSDDVKTSQVDETNASRIAEKEHNKDSLADVSRFTMVRSRIW